MLNLTFLALAACILLHSAAAQAQIARVLDTKGTALVERSGQIPRLLGAGERLDERDVINVARDSWAILEFNDQTRITLRPNTVFRLDSYKADAPEAMLLGLVKGGLRVVTGLLGKRNPSGVKVQTAVATIGIRGTEFDARLCEADCALEERLRPAPRPLVLPVARVVEMSGVVGAGRAGESVRLLVPGAMLNEGDAVAVGRGGSALLVFSDGARVALAENSRFAINHFRYSPARPGEGSAFLTLYDGHALITSGQLAKISPDAFLFRSALGVMRFMGTTASASGCVQVMGKKVCGSVSATVNPDGASASGSGSAGGTSATGEASAGSGGVSGSGSVTVGNNTVSGSTGTAQLNFPSGQQVLSNAEQLANEVVDGVRNITAVVVSTVGNQNQNFQQQAGNLVTQTQNTFQNTTQVVANAAVDQAVNALNTATAPIVAQMTGLMTQMRNNPPQTAAAAQLINSQIQALANQLNVAISQATSAASGVAKSDQFLAAAALLRIEGIALVAVGLTVTEAHVAGVGEQPGPGASKGEAVHQDRQFVTAQVNQVLSSPDMLLGMQLIGLEADELRAISNETNGGRAASMIQSEIAAHLGSQGTGVAKAFFTEMQASVLAAQQEAARIAAETKQRAAEEAARKLAEEKKAAAEAKAAAAAKLAAARAEAEKLAAEAKLRAEQEAARAAAALKNTAIAKLASERDRLNAVVDKLANSAAKTIPGGEAALNQLRGIAGRLSQLSPGDVDSEGEVAALMAELIPQLAAAFAHFVVASAPGLFPAPAQNQWPTEETTTVSEETLEDGTVVRVTNTVGPAGRRTVTETRKPNGVIEIKTDSTRDNLTHDNSIVTQYPDGSTYTITQRMTVDTITGYPIATSRREVGVYPDRGQVTSSLSEFGPDGVRFMNYGRITDANGNTEISPDIDMRVGPEGTTVRFVLAAMETTDGVRDETLPIDIRDSVNGGLLVVAAREVTWPDGTVIPVQRIVATSGQQGISARVDTAREGELEQQQARWAAEQARTKSASTAPNGSITVYEGDVHILGRGRITSGETLGPSGPPTRIPGLQPLKVAAALPDWSRESPRPVEEGLYVWVRDGAVQVSKDDKSVDVPAGNAAVATKDRVELLDTVPNFLRFDQTPKPFPAFGDTGIDAFRAEDGSLLNMCSVR